MSIAPIVTTSIIALSAGAFMGAVYWAIHVESPAPPPLGLVGLLGIVIGEAVVSHLVRLARSRRRRVIDAPIEANRPED